MRTRMKKVLIWLYCRNLLSMTAVAWMFERFDLKGR